jgi:hypothetical protein
VNGSSILRILKTQGLAPDIPEDLYHLIKKVRADVCVCAFATQHVTMLSVLSSQLLLRCAPHGRICSQSRVLPEPCGQQDPAAPIEAALNLLSTLCCRPCRCASTWS